MAAHVGFLCDAGGGIGTGHAMRCLALAETLQRDFGGHATFLCTQLAGSLRDRITVAGHDLVILPEAGPSSVAVITETQAESPMDALVIDGYHYDTAYRAALRKAISPVATFDDPGAETAHADIIINTSPAASADLYPDDICNVRLLLGPAYALVRGDILAQRSAANRPKGILITFGGSDPYEMSVPATEALRRRLPDVPLHVVFGGGVTNAADLGRHLQELPNVRVSHDVASLGPAIGGAEMAVVSAGTTLFEVAALGRPMLLVIVADNQSGLGHIDWADTVDVRGDLSAERIAEAAGALWEDKDRAARIAPLASQLVDGRGGQRILQALLGDNQKERAGTS